MSETRKEYLLGLLGLAVAMLLAWLLGAPVLRGGSAEGPPRGEFTAGDYRFKISQEPAVIGPGANRLAVQVQDPQGSAVAGARLRAVLLHPGDVDHSTPHLDLVADETRPGHYQVELELAGEGTWPLVLEIQAEGGGHADLVLQLTPGSDRIETLAATPAGIAYYTCPMHPSVKGAAAGQCPLCGMDLTPVSHEDLASGSVVVDARRRQLIGLQTAAAHTGPLTEEIRLIGTVRYDPAGTVDVALPLRGTVGEVFVSQEGTTVARGTPLFTISSPELRAREQELLDALRRSQDGQSAELRFARRSLLALGVSNEDVEQLLRERRAAPARTIVAPTAGRVHWTQVLPGMGFESGQSLLQIVDPARVQVTATVYENDLPLLRGKMPARVRLPYLGGTELRGTITHLGSALNRHSHTIDAYISLNYQGPPLPQNASADVFLDLVHAPQVLVPEEAVIHAGDTRLVFVDLGEGRLAPRRIHTGRRNRTEVQVLDGLQPGDQVVTAGAFLLASESKLKTGIEQW